MAEGNGSSNGSGNGAGRSKGARRQKKAKQEPADPGELPLAVLPVRGAHCVYRVQLFRGGRLVIWTVGCIAEWQRLFVPDLGFFLANAELTSGGELANTSLPISRQDIAAISAAAHERMIEIRTGKSAQMIAYERARAEIGALGRKPIRV